MAVTLSTDLIVDPKIIADYVSAYFDKKLIFGAFAVEDRTLVTKPGLLVEFPYFKSIGAAEEAVEDVPLAIDKIGDDSFTATVKEVGKAVGITRTALYKSAAGQDKTLEEISKQIGYRIAEKVDADLLTEMNSVGNYFQGFNAVASGDTFNIRSLLQAKMIGFGDRSNEAVVVFMHSRQAYDLLADPTSGFLKADAADPMFSTQGFIGRILGLALVVTDQVPAGAVVDGKQTYHAFIHTADPYGFMIKQDFMIEQDYDMLRREHVFAGTQWYAVKSFHGKVSTDNRRTVRLTTTVSA